MARILARLTVLCAQKSPFPSNLPAKQAGHNKKKLL